MSEKYVMFVDERGFLSTGTNDNLSMIGVVFEYDYCIELKNKEFELRARLNEYKEEIIGNNNVNIHLDDIILEENVYKNINKTQRTKFINELPSLLKNLKFTIISTTIKQDTSKVSDSYSKATKKLIRKFYSFIMKKNGESGVIIMEARKGHDNYTIQQKFFDIYNERNMNLSTLGNIEDKINTFIVCEKNNKTYGLGIEVLNVLNNILFRVSNGLREVDRKLISYIEYGNKEKVFNVIKHKMYKDTQIDIPSNQLQRIPYNNMIIFGKELKILKEQLNFKDNKINEKQEEINELNNVIKLLNQQLEEALLSRKSDNIIFQILSDMDFKMKGIENKTMFVKN